MLEDLMSLFPPVRKTGGTCFILACMLFLPGITGAQSPQDRTATETDMTESVVAMTGEIERTSDPRPFSVPLPVSKSPFDYRTLDPADFVLEARRVNAAIQVDGHLDEAEWQQADVAKDFFQLEPVEGAPATYPTEVRVMYDDKNLYVGFVCFDPNPEQIMAPDMQRDTRMSWSNDMVTVVIASLDHYREAFEFQTNPNGARSDSFVSAEGNNTDRDWNGLWNAASQVYDYGWSAEYVIPFHTLRFPDRGDQTWGINFGRRIQRNREESFWVPLSLRDGDQALYRFGKGGRLTTLSDITPGGRVQATPFTVLGGQSSRFTETAPSPVQPIAATALDNDMQRKLGGDLKVSVTSGMTLNATVNPDFAQVEADDEVVNLSRFEFQFTEKRPFFLERSDIFTLNERPQRRGPQRNFGDLTPQLFFSRRVGRQLPDGQTVPIDLGMRLTGKLGRTTVGFLNVQTRETQYDDDGEEKTEPLTNWQALRVRQDFGSRSSVGMLATFKEPNPRFDDRVGMALPRYAESDYNRVLGFDLNLASQATNHRGQITFAKSWTDTVSTSNQDWTFRIIERWQNRWLMYGVSYLNIGEDFISQTGLVRDEGLQRIGGGLTANTFLRRFGIRRINGGFRSNYVTRKDTDFSDADSWSFSPNVFLELERGLWISAS
ncbi:MAG: carbohydrate binding family 9 domain-containing protein, partial [Gemmatimonadetes bacterium]|nr:carbohydrate binding family 9 domain-containing protein [Gemmatimonadota bacterium]